MADEQTTRRARYFCPHVNTTKIRQYVRSSLSGRAATIELLSLRGTEAQAAMDLMWQVSENELDVVEVVTNLKNSIWTPELCHIITTTFVVSP